MIEIKNVVKIYSGSTFKQKKVPALDNINFKVNDGEVVAIFGENGAGKSTLIRIISSILRPTSGTCTVNGYLTTKDPKSAKMETGLLLGAETGLYPRLTVYENIKYHADLYRVSEEQFYHRMQCFSKIFKMKDYLNKRADELSFGMAQKTAIARAFIHDPGVILLDEPTTGLDIASAMTMYDFINESREKGKTVVFSSHRSEEILKLADRLIVLKSGRIVFSDSTKSLNRNNIDKFLCAYIGESGE